jgi:cytidylate kinase
VPFIISVYNVTSIRMCIRVVAACSYVQCWWCTMTTSNTSPGSLPGRIAIVGPSGAGKTFLATQLSLATGLPHVPLDLIHWEKEFQSRDLPTFRSLVSEAAANERWIIDGHFPQSGDIVWARAELMIWLDYPLHVVLRRLAGRKGKQLRLPPQEPSATKGSGQGRFSVLKRRVLRVHRCMMEQKALASELSKYPNLKVVHLKSPQEADRWLALMISDAELAPADTRALSDG